MIYVRSTHAVRKPDAAPTPNHGNNGKTSRFQRTARPFSHHRTTRSAAGSVAVTDLLSNAITNSAKATT